MVSIRTLKMSNKESFGDLWPFLERKSTTNTELHQRVTFLKFQRCLWCLHSSALTSLTFALGIQ